MAEALILEFPGGTADHYNAVNKLLGVDAQAGTGDWPAPLLSHTGAMGAGGLVVFEVWESQAAQAEFMSRLGPALAEAGVPQPSRMEWMPLLGRHSS